MRRRLDRWKHPQSHQPGGRAVRWNGDQRYESQLTLAVPYCVATYGAVSYRLGAARGEGGTRRESLRSIASGVRAAAVPQYPWKVLLNRRPLVDVDMSLRLKGMEDEGEGHAVRFVDEPS